MSSEGHQHFAQAEPAERVEPQQTGDGVEVVLLRLREPGAISRAVTGPAMTCQNRIPNAQATAASNSARAARRAAKRAGEGGIACSVP